jgi:hypothetical protein
MRFAAAIPVERKLNLTSDIAHTAAIGFEFKQKLLEVQRPFHEGSFNSPMTMEQAGCVGRGSGILKEKPFLTFNFC